MGLPIRDAGENMRNGNVQQGQNHAVQPRFGAPAAKGGLARQASNPIRLLLVDGQALFREAMRTCLNRARDVIVVGEVARLSDMADMIARTQPDVVLTDFCLPDAANGEILLELKTKCPGARVVVLTALQGEDCLLKALAGGAHGFVLKDAPLALVLKAIRAVRSGQTWVQREIVGALTKQLQRMNALEPEVTGSCPLTKRQRDVLMLLAAGRTTKEIARELYLSESTIRVHLTRVLDKLGLKNRIEAVRFAIREGLVKA